MTTVDIGVVFRLFVEKHTLASCLLFAKLIKSEV